MADRLEASDGGHGSPIGGQRHQPDRRKPRPPPVRRAQDATQPARPAARQQRGVLSKGLEVTHLIAAPAFECAADRASWKHDAQALAMRDMQRFHHGLGLRLVATPVDVH